MGNHLRVGVGAEAHAVGGELLPQFSVIFDDAVLHHRQSTAAITVGMGVVLLGFAVGGPAGMADAHQPRGSLTLHPCRQVHQLALGPDAMQLPCLHRGHTGRVVAAIFQLTKTLKQQRCCVPRANHRNDSAHTKKPGSAGLSLWVIDPKDREVAQYDSPMLRLVSSPR